MRNQGTLEIFTLDLILPDSSQRSTLLTTFSLNPLPWPLAYSGLPFIPPLVTLVSCGPRAWLSPQVLPLRPGSCSLSSLPHPLMHLQLHGYLTSWLVLGTHLSCNDRAPRTSHGHINLNISKLQLTVFLTLMAFIIIYSLFLTSYIPPPPSSVIFSA